MDMDVESNPYAAPTCTQRDVDAATGRARDAERIRREHFRQEATVQAIAIFYFYFSGVQGLVAAVGLMAAVLAAEGPRVEVALVPFALLLLVVAGLPFVIGRGLQTLQRWAAVAVACMCCIAILPLAAAIVLNPAQAIGPMLGVAANGYFLYSVSCKKAREIFSAEYREVVRQTPHARYRVAIVMSVPLAMVVGVVVLTVAAAFLVP